MTCLWSSDSFSWQPSDLCSFALLYHISVAVAIKSEKNLVYVCQLLHKKNWIWAAAEVISPLLSIFFFNFPSCLSHCLNTCTSTLSIFGYHNNLQFILLSVPESLCCVNRARGEMLYLAAGPLPTLKGSSVILEKFWTFFFFQLCKRKYNQLAITHLNNPPPHPPFSQFMKSS